LGVAANGVLKFAGGPKAYMGVVPVGYLISPVSSLCCSMYCLCQLCCSVYCLCENVYCTAATGCQPSCSKQIYRLMQTSHHKTKFISQVDSIHNSVTEN